MAKIYCTPAAGKTFRDPCAPEVQFPPEGDWRDDKPAYRRLERTRDLIITDGPAAAAGKPAKK